MRLVDERGVCRLRTLDPRTRGLGSAGVERDRDDLEPMGLELLPQRLPPGQVEAAASPGGPGENEDLLATQAAEREGVPVEVG